MMFHSIKKFVNHVTTRFELPLCFLSPALSVIKNKDKFFKILRKPSPSLHTIFLTRSSSHWNPRNSLKMRWNNKFNTFAWLNLTIKNTNLKWGHILKLMVKTYSKNINPNDINFTLNVQSIGPSLLICAIIA